MPNPTVHKRMLSLIPETHSYHVSKVYDGLYHHNPLAKVNTHYIHDYYTKIKDELSVQIENWHDQISALALETDELDYIFGRLISWADNDALLDNRDARVFLEAFTGHFKKLRDILASLDDPYGWQDHE